MKSYSYRPEESLKLCEKIESQLQKLSFLLRDDIFIESYSLCCNERKQEKKKRYVYHKSCTNAPPSAETPITDDQFGTAELFRKNTNTCLPGTYDNDLASDSECSESSVSMEFEDYMCAHDDEDSHDDERESVSESEGSVASQEADSLLPAENQSE